MNMQLESSLEDSCNDDDDDDTAGEQPLISFVDLDEDQVTATVPAELLERAPEPSQEHTPSLDTRNRVY